MPSWYWSSEARVIAPAHRDEECRVSALAFRTPVLLDRYRPDPDPLGQIGTRVVAQVSADHSQHLGIGWGQAQPVTDTGA
jgi:hypothetical protein